MSAKRLTTSQAAELRGVTRGRIYALYKAGRLKGRKDGRDLTFLESDVIALQVKSVGRPRKK